MSELLPLSDCPFCGSDARYQEDDSAASGGNDWCIVCGECGASSDYYRSEAESAAAWNTRPPQQPAKDEAVDWVRTRHSSRARSTQTYPPSPSRVGSEMNNQDTAALEVAAGRFFVGAAAIVITLIVWAVI